MPAVALLNISPPPHPQSLGNGSDRGTKMDWPICIQTLYAAFFYDSTSAVGLSAYALARCVLPKPLGRASSPRTQRIHAVLRLFFSRKLYIEYPR
jgi:hypothetical protein